jgi:hypothetical protein
VDILAVSSAAHLLVGILMLWGRPVPDPFRWVILSRSLPEFLGRFMPHLRDFLATVFYYPALFSLKLRSAKLRFVLAVAFAIFFGNSFVHLLRYGFFLNDVPGHLARMKDVCWENFLMTTFVIIWVTCGAWTQKYFSDWIPRGKIGGRVWGAFHFVITYLVFSTVYYFHVE